MKRLKGFLVRWLLGSTIDQVLAQRVRLDEMRSHIDALAFFAADTCDVVNPLIVRVEKLEDKETAPKTVPRRLRVKHK